MFHIGAIYALKNCVLNMSVLVSLGILTSYLFSVGLTLFAPVRETFFEAAVMLAVFLLFGHWMEMKARRGSSDSVRKLLDLTPQRATVEREGRQLELAVAEVVVDDVVVLKPGDKGAGGLRGARRPFHRRREHDHWRKQVISGGDQPGRLASFSCHEGRCRHGPGADRPSGGDCPEQ